MLAFQSRVLHFTLESAKIKDTEKYLNKLKRKQEKKRSSSAPHFSDSPFNDFLTKEHDKKKIALIDAFFDLGKYTNTMTQFESKAFLFHQLQVAYQAAYPDDVVGKK